MGSSTDRPSRLPYVIAALGAIALLAAGAVWILRRGDELATLRGHAGVVRAIVFTPDGSILVSTVGSYSVPVPGGTLAGMRSKRKTNSGLDRIACKAVLIPDSKSPLLRPDW